MRKPTRPNKPRRARLKSFAAPIGGWIKNENIAKPSPDTPQGAEKLVNYFVTATGAELRGGSVVYATLGAAESDVTAFLRYKNGQNERLFAAITTGIYDITVVADPVVSPPPVVSGLTSADWSSVQFATTGGVFLVAVNGADDMRFYDGEYWYPINGQDLHLLKYDGQTVNFTTGATVTGGTSGASATIIAVRDNGSTGSIVVGNITGGPFQNNEALTDGSGGAAVADGVAVQIFNGISFEDGSGPVAGMQTSDLAYVWAYKSRLFFIEKDSMNVWYASLDQVGGTLTAFPLGGIFSLGGSLMFGGVWSTESGADGGLSAQCIFVTTEGEVAVYGGGDPGSATDFGIVGVYRIGKPLGPDAWHRAGGDIVISTDIGHVPLSQAINRDLAALSPASVSYPIETAWNETVAQRRFADWHCIVWPERQMLLIAIPTGDGQQPKMYIANVRTGRWSEFTGWDAKCLVTFQGRLFFGSTQGRVVEGYVTGLDQGQTYSGIYVPLFDDCNSPASLKVALMARAVTRSNSSIATTITMQYDYIVDLPPPPSANVTTGGSVWGSATWGEDSWAGDESTKIIEDGWQSVSGAGTAFAPGMQTTSGSIAPIASEIVRLDVTYDLADIVT